MTARPPPSASRWHEPSTACLVVNPARALVAREVAVLTLVRNPNRTAGILPVGRLDRYASVTPAEREDTAHPSPARTESSL